MNVKKIISGTLASIMIAQSLVYGDGTCKGLLHNDTIKAFATESYPENYSISSQAEYESSLSISGYIDLEDNRSREITVLIFDEWWNTIASTTVYPNEYFSVATNNITGNTTHIKIECNGYLPRFYKDMGFGSYQLGTAENPEILFFGDTTYNTGADNQWSDEVINYDDLNFVANQLGKIKGDENYDEYYDFNQDGIINDDDVNIIGKFDGAIYEDNVWYTSSDKYEWYTSPNDIKKYDINNDGFIDGTDQEHLCEIYPYWTYRGDEDFDDFEYMDIDGNGCIEEHDYSCFVNYVNKHNGHNPYNDYIYNLTLTGNSYHNGAMYLENTHLDLSSYELTINGNFVFRTANPYNPMWHNNPECVLNINGGTLDIKGQFDFGQANSYDKIIMTNENGKLYINGIWNYITLADMEGLWTAGTIYFSGSTWQVNEASGDKSIYSTGTHSIYFCYTGGQQVIRWANTQDCIYDEATKEYNTLRRFNFDYRTSEGNYLGIIFPCGYSSENYYFRADLPEDIYNNTYNYVIPYEDWSNLPDYDGNGIPDIIDKQIELGIYDAIDNTWITTKYGENAEEFIENHPTALENKEALVNTLEYTYSNYDEPVAEAIIDYIGRSLEQIVLGNYTNEVTLLGTGGQIVLSIVGLDLPCDLRDLSYDVDKWGDIIFGDEQLTWEFAGQSFTDLVALFPLVGCLKYSDEASTLLKNSDELYNKAAVDSVTECFSHGKALKNETEIAETTTENVKSVIKQSNELLGKDGKFLDESLEEQYQQYLKRKSKQKNATARDRLNWKEESDYWKYDSPTARGNRFNVTAQSKYNYNEVNLISNSDPNAFTRVDSYVPGKQIISRKATDLENIEFSTFEDYLSELAKKYKPGTTIRSNKFPELDGQELKGQMCLQIPKSNETFSDIERYKKYAKDNYDIEIIFLEE